MDTLSLYELRAMVGERLFFKTPGLTGILRAVRADGTLEVALPFGAGYLRAPSVMLPGGRRLAAGCACATPYGPGRVLAAEARPEVGVVYTVALLSARAPQGAPPVATAYLAAPSVRATSSAAQNALLWAVAEAEELRLRGNRSYEAKDYGAAIEAYEGSVAHIAAHVQGADSASMDASVESVLVEALLKNYGNLAHSLNLKGGADNFRKAVATCKMVRPPARPPAARARRLGGPSSQRPLHTLHHTPRPALCHAGPAGKQGRQRSLPGPPAAAAGQGAPGPGGAGGGQGVRRWRVRGQPGRQAGPAGGH